MGKDGDRDVVTIQEGLGHPAMWRVEWLEFQQKKRNEGNQFILVGLGLKFFFLGLGTCGSKARKSSDKSGFVWREREESKKERAHLRHVLQSQMALT